MRGKSLFSRWWPIWSFHWSPVCPETLHYASCQDFTSFLSSYMKSYSEMGIDLVGLAEERCTVFFLMSMLKYCMLSVGNFQLKFYPSCFSLWNSVGPVASSTAFPFWWVKHTFFPAATLCELSRSDNTKSWKVCDACSKQLMGTDACRHPVVLETLTA